MAVVKGGTSCDAKSPIGPKYKLEAPGAINVMRTGAGSIVIFVVSVIIVIHAMRACEHQWLSGRTNPSDRVKGCRSQSSTEWQ